MSDLVGRSIPDKRICALLAEIIGSFGSLRQGDALPRGLPLGNLTSQLLVNVYMNEFDQFVKHKLKAKYYVRYADDFVILSASRLNLDALLSDIRRFLLERLHLDLHPDKVSIKTFASGVDFLGWVHFPDHRVLRTTTTRRMFKRIEGTEEKKETVQSYLGLIRHGNTQKLRRKIEGGIGDV